MRPVAPTEEQKAGKATTIIGDPLRDMHAVEYVVEPSTNYPGKPTVTVWLELDEHDRELVDRGALLVLTLDGGELPWSLSFEPVPEFVPVWEHDDYGYTRPDLIRWLDDRDIDYSLIDGRYIDDGLKWERLIIDGCIRVEEGQKIDGSESS